MERLELFRNELNRKIQEGKPLCSLLKISRLIDREIIRYYKNYKC